MKPFKEVVNYPIGNSFLIKYDNFPHFSVPWHFHNEYEIVYIIKSFGEKFVGDVLKSFAPGDLSFYGTSLPHFYLNDELFYTGNPDYFVNAIVLQFPKDYFAAAQLMQPEFSSIKKLLNASSCGLKFSDDVSAASGIILHNILKASGIERHLLLVRLLDFLGSSPCDLIASAGYTSSFLESEESRMAKIYTFITRNYTRKITLKEIAGEIGMSSTAFCRYFHDRTGKTFAQFVNELRISYACKLLTNGNQTVVQICDETGFYNLSNFNRQFQNIMGKSPSKYRESFRVK